MRMRDRTHRQFEWLVLPVSPSQPEGFKGLKGGSAAWCPRRAELQINLRARDALRPLLGIGVERAARPRSSRGNSQKIAVRS